MELKDYKQLLINYPKDSADPFEYPKGDKPYLFWLSNRVKNCSLLFDDKALDPHRLELPPEFSMGYTNLLKFERLFLLHIGDGKYLDTYKNPAELLYCKDGISEDDLVADTFLFVFKEGNEDVQTTQAAWKWNPSLIRELTGKENYSIADARKIISYIRNGNTSIYACIGVMTIEDYYWH